MVSSSRRSARAPIPSCPSAKLRKAPRCARRSFYASTASGTSCGDVIGWWRIAGRSLQMVRAAAVAAGTFGVAWWRLRGRDRRAALRALGRALVGLCTTLGATFIKVGQIASTRGDLLPAPLVAELATLRDQVPPFPFAAVRQTIEHDLDQP